MKKIIIGLSIFICLIGVSIYIVLYILSNGNPYTKYLAEKNIPEYLNEKGYSDSDLKAAYYTEPKAATSYTFYQGRYLVIFADEPEITYYYGITKNEKKVFQFCDREILLPNGVTDVVTEKTKHSEEDCLN